MKNFWIKTFRRLVAASVIIGASAFSSAMTYAATIAFDTPLIPHMRVGSGRQRRVWLWQWNFDNGYSTTVMETMDIFSHPNDLGRAWTLYLPDGNTPGRPPFLPIRWAVPPSWHGGREIPGGLQPGDTLHVVIDNPTEKAFFKGYTVKFTNGGANLCYSGGQLFTPAYDPFSITKRMRIGTFEYFTNGQWYAEDNGPSGSHGTTLFDLDTHHGMRIDLTITSADTYSLKMTPLNDPNIAYTRSGTLSNPGAGPIDWVEFEHYNTDSDYHPSPSIAGGETDFYISNMWITQIPEPSSVALVVLGAVVFGLVGALVAKRSLASLASRPSRQLVDVNPFADEIFVASPDAP